MTKPISVPCAIAIRGEGWQEAPHEAVPKGTWLSVEQVEAPAITFISAAAKGASIESVAFVEPGQTVRPDAHGGWAPQAFPPVIVLRNVEGFTYLHNLYMHGVSRGIESSNGGRTTIDGLYGQFFDNAITLDSEMDVSRINNVHSWPYISGEPPIMAYQQTHLETIILGRVDGAFIDNIFTYGAEAGLRFISGVGRNPGVATGIQIGKLGCDSVAHCLRVDAVGVTAMVDEMRQFGQEGTSSGHPLPGADAVLVNGEISLLAGQVEARMIDKSFLTVTSRTQCSNIRIANAFIDFSASQNSNPVPVAAVACGPHGETNEILFGTKPALVLKAAR
ncbi:hypothetical protein [Gluconacetobacter sp.]|uniref:hypothetical protein n=1 Tax=Gluconacetobacter sp. TaxID=1935994 RepID=UPI0039EB23B5